MEHVTLDPGVVSSSPMLGVETTYNIYRERERERERESERERERQTIFIFKYIFTYTDMYTLHIFKYMHMHILIFIFKYIETPVITLGPPNNAQLKILNHICKDPLTM